MYAALVRYRQEGIARNAGQGLYLYLVGALALWMRQTNIFWVAIFFGGLDLVHSLQVNALPGMAVSRGQRLEAVSFSQGMHMRYADWTRGLIHDVALEDAEIQGSPHIFIFKLNTDRKFRFCSLYHEYCCRGSK